MRISAPLCLVCFAIMAAPPAALSATATASADAARRAACREQALAEGLRSEEVILDYVHECLEDPGSAAQTGAAASSVSSDVTGNAAPAVPRPNSTAGVD